jgi:fatty aldehyde-generating acyl-ACP reductase
VSSPRKNKFALIAHPPELALYRKYIRFLKPEKSFRDELILKLFEWTPSYTVRRWKNFTLDGGRFADGVMIMVPFLPEMRDIKLARVVEKIEQALRIARDEGCTVAALGAFTSIVLQGREEEIGEKYGIRLTSGNTFTAALIVRSIEELARRFNRPLENETLALVGASGDIGTGCLVYFGSRVKKLVLTARGLTRLEQVLASRKKAVPCEVEVTSDNRRAIEKARFCVFATSSYGRLFHVNDFEPGSVVCDASAPLNVAFDPRPRRDVFLYHGGVAALPRALSPGFDIGVASSRMMYGCMMEGVLHAFAPDLPRSWGRGNITRAAIERYLGLLDDGPGVSPGYSVGGHRYTRRELERYSRCFSAL